MPRDVPRSLLAIGALLVELLHGATALAERPSGRREDAASPHARRVEPGTNTSRHLYGVEVSPLSPFVGIWVAQGTYSFWRYGDSVTGYAHRKEQLTDVGRAYGHTLILGYRQFFWRGLNLDFETWNAYDEITSYVDGGTYRGFDGWAAVLPGYRLDTVGDRTARLYFLAQVAFAFPTFRTNAPPGYSPEPFVVPVIWIGARSF